jgi:hypothetical protein
MTPISLTDLLAVSKCMPPPKGHEDTKQMWVYGTNPDTKPDGRILTLSLQTIKNAHGQIVHRWIYDGKVALDY